MPLRQPIGRQDGSSVPLRQPNRNAGWVGESGNSVYAEWPRIKIALAVTWQGGGGGSIRCTKASSSSILSADLKSETKK